MKNYLKAMKKARAQIAALELVGDYPREDRHSTQRFHKQYAIDSINEYMKSGEWGDERLIVEWLDIYYWEMSENDDCRGLAVLDMDRQIIAIIDAASKDWWR